MASAMRNFTGRILAVMILVNAAFLMWEGYVLAFFGVANGFYLFGLMAGALGELVFQATKAYHSSPYWPGRWEDE